jgi:hypothetical protein
MIRSILGFTFLAACKGGGGVPECVDDGGCLTGQACVEQACKDVECVSSQDCGIGHWCDVGTDHTCKEGCGVDDDCAAGKSCDVDAHECQAYGCRDTQLDCNYGETCNNGTCEKVPGPYCKAGCNAFTGGGCGSDASCYSWDYYGTETYCLVTCNPSDVEPCPRGYECADATGLGDYVCYGDCRWLNAQ